MAVAMMHEEAHTAHSPNSTRMRTPAGAGGVSSCTTITTNPRPHLPQPPIIIRPSSIRQIHHDTLFPRGDWRRGLQSWWRLITGKGGAASLALSQELEAAVRRESGACCGVRACGVGGSAAVHGFWCEWTHHVLPWEPPIASTHTSPLLLLLLGKTMLCSRA